MTTSVLPRTLSLGRAREVVRGRLGPEADERFCTACHRPLRKPLLLHELVKAVRAEGVRPDAANVSVVRSSVRGGRARRAPELARLSPEAAAVARAAAVLGDGATLSEVAALRTCRSSGPPAPPGRSPGRDHPARAAAWLRPPARPRGRLPRPPARRARDRPRAAARLLVEAGASPQRVAAHLLLAPPEGRPEVLETLRAGADEALKAGGAESAVTYLRRALDETPTADRNPRSLLDLGLAEAMAAHPRPPSACATPTSPRPTARSRPRRSGTDPALTSTRPRTRPSRWPAGPR